MSIVLEVATATVPFMAFTSNVVETGFKVSRFLAELADAPAQIRSLRDFVDENTLLADAYFSYLEAIGAHHGTNATGSEVVKQDRSQKGQRERMRKDGSTALKNDKCGAQLSSAIGALSRELKILDQLSLKHSKIGRSWRNFQFVLEKRQVAVAITNLERTKFILISGLTIANSQLSTLEHWNIEDTVQKCSEKMTSRVNALRETLLLEMRDQHRIMQRTIQQHNESVLGSKLNKYGSSHGHAPSCLSSKQQQDQLVLIRKQLSISNRNSIRRHNETRSLLVANRPGFEERISSKIAHLHEAITKIGPNITKESGNVIHYMGDRRDMVVAYLLPLRAQLDSAIEIILTQRPTRIPPCYIIKLRSRFQHLVASATQEEAARHPMSTASSFDRWLYGLSKRPTRKRTSFISTDRYRITRNSDIDNSADAEPIEKQHERPNLMTVAVEIDSGLIRISILPQSTISISDDEYFDAHLNFIPRHHKSSLLIDIRFAEVVAQQTQPKLHVQLNAFNVVDLSEYDQLYRSLFRDGSIKDVDSALRTGKVSPYHVSICGINLCIYLLKGSAEPVRDIHPVFKYIVRFGRAELLQYLDSNGVGLSNIDGDYSALLGYTRGLSLSYLGSSNVSVDAYRKVLDSMKEQTYMPDTILAGLLCMASIPTPKKSVLDSHTQARSLLQNWTTYLKEQNLNIEQQDEAGRTPLLSGLIQVGYPSSLFIQLLLEFGANPDATDDQGRDAIQLAMYSKSLLRSTSKHSWSEITEEKLCLLLGAGADIHHRDKHGWTTSQNAKKYDCWGEWCRALERHGQDIADVVAADGEA